MRLELRVLKGEDDDVFDMVADLVEVFVLIEVSDSTLVCVKYRLSNEVRVGLTLLVDVFEDVGLLVGIIFPPSPMPVLQNPNNIINLSSMFYIISVSFFYIDKCQHKQNVLLDVLKKLQRTFELLR